MNIKYISNLEFDIYIKKELINNINFNNKEEIEKYLKKLFKLLDNKYNIKVEGFYDITIYIDKYYGVVIHLEKEDIDYYYFKNQVEMRLSIVHTNFLYLVDDIPNINKFKIIIKNNNIYLKIKKELTNKEMMYLLEHSKIIYKKLN